MEMFIFTQHFYRVSWLHRKIMATINSINKLTQNLTVDPGVAGDAYIQHRRVSTPVFSMGVDDDAGDSFKISHSAALGTSDVFIMTQNGERTLPLQSLFLAYLSTTVNSVTGDGTGYVVIYDTVIKDYGSDYNNATGVFTAPTTGRYYFNNNAYYLSGVTGGTHVLDRMATSNGVYYGSAFPTNEILPGFYGYQNAVVINGGIFCDMDAGDTAYMTIVGGGTGTSKVDDIYGGNCYTWFGGYLVC